MTDFPNDAFSLTDAEEQLRRQVHPDLRQLDGGLMSTAFMPSNDDNGLLSTLRGSVDAAEAYRRWVEDERSRSDGTWPIAVGDLLNVGLNAFDDSATVKPDHASVDFRHLSRGAVRKIGRKLRDAAMNRGALFTPDA